MWEGEDIQTPRAKMKPLTDGEAILLSILPPDLAAELGIFPQRPEIEPEPPDDDTDEIEDALIEAARERE